MIDKKSEINLQVYTGEEPSADELNAETERVDAEFVEYIRKEFLS